MDCHHCITEYAERKKGQHLRMEDRGAIKVLKKQGLGPRAIARQIGCAPSTVTNELRRGTPTRKSNKGSQETSGTYFRSGCLFLFLSMFLLIPQTPAIWRDAAFILQNFEG